MTAVKSDVLAESAILNVDGPVVYLHSSNGEVPSGEKEIIHQRFSVNMQGSSLFIFFFFAVMK